MPNITLSPQLLAFQERYIEFSGIILRTVEERFQSDGTRTAISRRLQIDENDWKIVPHLSHAYEDYIPLYDDPIFSTLEARRCIEAFIDAELAIDISLTDDAGTQIENPSFEQLYPFVTFRLTDPIRHLLRKSTSTRVTSGRMRNCLKQYIDIWLDRCDVEPAYAPMYNLKSELHSIKVHEYLSIVPFSREKKAELFESMGPLVEALDIQSYVEASHVAVLRKIDASYRASEKKKIRRDAQTALQVAITSLRLINSEFVGTPGFMSFSRMKSVMRSVGGVAPLEDFDIPSREYFRNSYTLSRENLTKFRRYVRMLSGNGFATWNRLELPLKQFNRYSRRQRNEDKVLDIAILLESVLLHGADRELQYRLGLRAARLLRTMRDPQDTVNRIGCLYQVRNKIVHQNKSLRDARCVKFIEQRGLEPSTFTQSVESLAREILIEIIREVYKGEELNQLCARLDREILAAVRRP